MKYILWGYPKCNTGLRAQLCSKHNSVKKSISLISFLLALCLSANAQDMKTVFVNIPDSLCALLTKVNREDFADFLESNMKAQVKNKFGGTSEMKTLTPDYLLLQTSSSSTLQMKLLPVNDSVKVVCVVNTVSGPAEDSSIRFFSTGWEELQTKQYFTPPAVDRFYLNNDTIDREKLRLARSKADMNLMKMSLSPTENTLSLTYTTPDYLNQEMAEELKPFLVSDPIVCRWLEGGFE